MTSRMVKAFVSSTYLDLKEHRRCVIDALQKAGIHVDPMENWTADAEEPKALSQKRIAGCHLCVLLVALRRGHVPPGESLSITQMEYEAARRSNIDMLVYLFDDGGLATGDYLWPRRFDEWHTDEGIRTWRQELQQRHGCKTFARAPEPLGQFVLEAVSRWLQEQAPHEAPGPALADQGSPRQLPRSPEDFVGRGDLLDELHRQITRGFTSALHGMGGVGKTSLALKLAERLLDHCPDGQVYLDLRGVDPQPLAVRDAMAHVIHAFHREEALPQNDAVLAGRYRTVLAGRRVLLLLDNAASREQVAPLLPPDNAVLVLITSRRHFHLPGLTPCDLDALAAGRRGDVAAEHRAAVERSGSGGTGTALRVSAAGVAAGRRNAGAAARPDGGALPEASGVGAVAGADGGGGVDPSERGFVGGRGAGEMA